MAAKNVLQKHWDGQEWIELHPVTKSTNVYSPDGKTVEQKLQDLMRSYIEEIGKNENGTYIRWTDGTQICYVKKQVTVTTQQYFLFHYASINALFPASFTENPIVTGNVDWSSALSLRLSAFPLGCLGEIYFIVAEENSNITIDIMAIGRWK